MQRRQLLEHVNCRPAGLFFFQAEDGIRDKLVTGVQTCALPISLGTMDSNAPPFLTITLSEATLSSSHVMSSFFIDFARSVSKSCRSISEATPIFRKEGRTIKPIWPPMVRRKIGRAHV